jgi:CRISPR-associated protein Csd1
MILQELVRYYERKVKDPESALAVAGFERKEIPFVITLDAEGRFVQIEDTRTTEGKRKRARSYLVPQGVKRSSGVAANLLWDTAEYVLGMDARGKAERVLQQHAEFIKRLSELPGHDAGVRAVGAFLANIPMEELKQSPSWEEIQESNPFMTFQLAADTFLVSEREAVVQGLVSGAAPTNPDGRGGICLVSGRKSQIERLHPAIKGVWGAQTSGANIVSFNQRSFESYGKEQKQGENAPVGKTAAFAYTTALNHLLSRDSRQRIQVGDASTVFWAGARCYLEDSFASYFTEPEKDNPDANTAVIAALYRSVEQGSCNVSEDDTPFFVLGLSPNAARISIRFWQTGKVREFAERIKRYFDDIKMVHAPFEPRYLSLFRLLVNTAVQGKADNIPPNLAGETMLAILGGLPFPETLLPAVLRRIRAEHEVSYPRAALIKACINRKTRWGNPVAEEDLKVSLDPANTNAGYRLGRLFATLEKVQEEASSDGKPGKSTLNATIRDRYYGAASSTPVTVFSTLMKLNKHHLSKLERPETHGLALKREKLIEEIVEEISDFPPHLTIADQGRFAIGYYHQKQAFYVKKSETVQGETE